MTTIFFLQSVSWLHSDVTPCNSHPPLFGRERNLTFQTQPCPYFCHAVETHTKVCAALRGAEVKAWLSNGGLISDACLGAARLLRAKCQGGKDLLWCWLISDVAQMQRKALPNYSKEKKKIDCTCILGRIFSRKMCNFLIKFLIQVQYCSPLPRQWITVLFPLAFNLPWLTDLQNLLSLWIRHPDDQSETLRLEAK